MGDRIDISRKDGSTFPGYLATPADPGPGVVVCHAYWGLTPHFERLCDRFAAEGYTAIAPSLYGGQASEVPEEADLLMRAMDEEQAEFDLFDTLDRLLSESMTAPGPVGVIGFSMGGWAACRLATQRTEVGAVAPFYGYSLGADYEASRAAVQGHFANEEDPDAAWFDERMRTAGREFENFLYPDSLHGFFNEDHPEDYDAAAAALSWDRVLTLFGSKLRTS
jgi:carboxymethylenebutenolidase